MDDDENCMLFKEFEIFVVARLQSLIVILAVQNFLVLYADDDDDDVLHIVSSTSFLLEVIVNLDANWTKLPI